MKKLGSQVVACEGDVAAKAGPLIPQVVADLEQPAGWAQALDVLLEAEGPAAVCAVDAVIADLENKQSNTSAPALESPSQTPDIVKLIRAHAWQQAQKNRARPAPKPWRTSSVRL